jgi:hypothetical protein
MAFGVSGGKSGTDNRHVGQNIVRGNRKAAILVSEVTNHCYPARGMT